MDVFRTHGQADRFGDEARSCSSRTTGAGLWPLRVVLHGGTHVFRCASCGTHKLVACLVQMPHFGSTSLVRPSRLLGCALGGSHCTLCWATGIWLRLSVRRPRDVLVGCGHCLSTQQCCCSVNRRRVSVCTCCENVQRIFVDLLMATAAVPKRTAASHVHWGRCCRPWLCRKCMHGRYGAWSCHVAPLLACAPLHLSFWSIPGCTLNEYWYRGTVWRRRLAHVASTYGNRCVVAMGGERHGCMCASAFDPHNPWGEEM